VACMVQLLWGGYSSADPSTSANYSMVESTLGGSGDNGSASTSYKSIGGDNGGATLGDTAIGNSTSTTYQTNSGFNTSETPALTFIVNTTQVNFGILSSSATRTGTATFSVKNYTTTGYVVQSLGTAPTYNGNTITPLASNSGSITGTQQFGINVVSNTTPSVGANPVQVPDASFSSGVAASGYNTSNSYRYVSGETIATATKNSGQTDYTISYIINISATTPPGAYTMQQSLLCTGTY
jgi:hypothetical protein